MYDHRICPFNWNCVCVYEWSMLDGLVGLFYTHTAYSIQSRAYRRLRFNGGSKHIDITIRSNTHRSYTQTYTKHIHTFTRQKGE